MGSSGAPARPAPNPPNAPPARRSRQTGIPPDFAVTAEMAAWAEGEGFSPAFVAAETEKFRDYWQGSGGLKADWAATWRVWLRKAAEERPAPRGSPPGRRGAGGYTAEELAAMARGRT